METIKVIVGMERWKRYPALQGKLAMHNEVLKEAITIGRGEKLISRTPLSGVERFEWR